MRVALRSGSASVSKSKRGSERNCCMIYLGHIYFKFSQESVLPVARAIRYFTYSPQATHLPGLIVCQKMSSSTITVEEST